MISAASAVYLGSLCLAETIRIERPLPDGLIEELSPIVDRVVALRNGEMVPSETAGSVEAVSAFLASEES